MVMLVGQVERKDFGRLALQEQNYSRLLSEITKLVIEVTSPSRPRKPLRGRSRSRKAARKAGGGDPARGHFR